MKGKILERFDAWEMTDRLEHEQGRGDPFAAAIRATRMPMIITDPRLDDNPIVFANDAFLALTGYERDEITGRNCRFLQGVDTDRDTVVSIKKAIEARTDIKVDILNYRKDRSPFWNTLYVSPVFSKAGELQFFFASQVDVTEAISTDRNKDMMAAELAHRIKNSLAIISAFVSFELRQAAEPCVTGYQAMQSRINAVGELYDVIARSSAFGPVDMPAYLAGIAASIRSSLLGEGSKIEIALDVEPFTVIADNAVPIGLLVNELATNAVKYAFPDNKGRIILGFRQRDGEFTLSVQDDGVGLDGSERRSASSGMGTRFVDAFVRQIGGTLARSSGAGGTTITARLPTSILSP